MMIVKTAAAIVGCAAVLVRADVITFDDLAHGEIVDNQYSASNGLTISAVNLGGGPDLAAAFNTNLSGTADPDLEGPPWATGNLPLDTEFGNALIIAENDGGSGDGILDSPDDEGSRPAGTLVFDFDRSISEFGFDLLDVEGPEEYGPHSGYVMTFYSEDATMASIGFGNFITRDGAVYGDNSPLATSPARWAW
jgi:hypothetical protein